MNISPLSQRTSSKGIPPTETFVEEIGERAVGIGSEFVERLNYAEELVNPIKVPIHFYEGSGYAGTLPTTKDSQLWPGPRGGAFIWLSSGSEVSSVSDAVRSKQIVRLHRLELQIFPSREEETIALYSCRETSLQRASPTVGFFKKLFSNPSKTIIHPVNTLSELEAQKGSDLGLLADFPFGALGGRDPRPVIWNALRGKVREFDPKSLKIRTEQDLLTGGAAAISREPIFDESTGNFLILQRTDGIGSDSRYSQYRLIVLIPNFPRMATFMAPRSLSLNLLAVETDWAICSCVFKDRRLFYLLSKREGRLMAVYQSSVSSIKGFVKLRLVGDNLEMVTLMREGSLRKYLFPRVGVEMARFEGSAGLLTSFPVAEFETVHDGPFDQVNPFTSGYFARISSTLHRLNSKFMTEQSRPMSPQHLTDFAIFPLSRDGRQNCLAVLGTDPYTGRISMNLLDSGEEGEINFIAKIELGTANISTSSLPPIFIPTRSSST